MINGDAMPNPGSDAAIELGCTCPGIDNLYGDGYMIGDYGPVFVYNLNCPLHGTEARRDE